MDDGRPLRQYLNLANGAAKKEIEKFVKAVVEGLL